MESTATIHMILPRGRVVVDRDAHYSGRPLFFNPHNIPLAEGMRVVVDVQTFEVLRVAEVTP